MVVNKGRLITGNNLTIDVGGGLKLLDEVFLFAEIDLKINAKGCPLFRKERTYSAKNFLGTCMENFNRSPRATISTDSLSGNTPLKIAFDGSSSQDIDGTVQQYEWSFPDNSTLSGANVEKIFTRGGAYTVWLTVTDDDGAKDRAKVVINVINTFNSPTAVAQVSPTEGETPLTVALDGSNSTDPDDDIVKYEWIFDDGQTLTGETQERIFESPGTFQVSLKVTDDDNLSHQTESISITVEQGNAPPVMKGDQSFNVRQNETLAFTLSGATDPEGLDLTYSLVNSPVGGVLFDCLGKTNDLDCIFRPDSDFTGRVFFTYKANDGEKDSSTVSVVSLTYRTFDKRPVAVAGTDKEANTGDVIDLDGGRSFDPDENPVTYLWKITQKPSMSRSRLSNPTSKKASLIVDRNGEYKVALTVNDGQLDSLPDEIVITVAGEGNSTPTLAQIPTPRSFQLGQELRFTLSGTDTDTGDTLSFSASSLPKNARLNSKTGEFRFTPEETGDHTISFTVMDESASVSQDVVIKVLPSDL